MEDNHCIDLIQSDLIKSIDLIHFRGTSLNGQVKEMRLLANAEEWSQRQSGK